MQEIRDEIINFSRDPIPLDWINYAAGDRPHRDCVETILRNLAGLRRASAYLPEDPRGVPDPLLSRPVLRLGPALGSFAGGRVDQSRIFQIRDG